MNIKDIIAADLRTMDKTEGIIFQGCGGDPQEWVDGINDILTESEILLDGTKFSGALRFQHEGLTCMLFEFKDEVKLDIGKLAMWRLQTRDQFGGMWLSDYVPNRLGGFVQVSEDTQHTVKEKPDCPLIGQDGNIFNLMGIALRTLKQNEMVDEAQEMRERITASGSYDEALNIISEYVNITTAEDMEEEIIFGGM